MEDKLNVIVKNLVSEYLETTKVLDLKLQSFVGAHKELTQYKTDNPDAKASDIKDKLLGVFQMQQQGALMMKDAEAYLNRLVALKIVADFARIDLGLSEEDKDIFERISRSVKLFYTSRNGNLVVLEPEIIDAFTSKTTEKYGTDDKLQEILNNI